MGKRNLILIVLLIIVGIIIFLSLKKEKESEKVVHYYPFKNIKLNEIKEFKIKDFTIKNENGKWLIDNVTCNVHKVEYLLNLLKKQDFSNIITEDKKIFKKFNVTEKDAVVVEIKTNDGKNYKLYIGKITPDGNGCYIRYNDKIFLITQNIKIDFNKTKSEFYLEKPKKKNK